MSGIEKLITNGTSPVSGFIKSSLIKQPKIATAVESGTEKILDSLNCLAANSIRINIKKASKPLLTEVSAEKLKKLYETDPRRFNLIIQVYKQMLFQNLEKINPETFDAFIDELIKLKNTTTLEKALKSGVTITFNSPKGGVSCYANDTRTILLHKNHIDSLAHELGHAFDHNSPVGENSSLHRSLIPKLKVKDDGTYEVLGVLPNAVQKVKTEAGIKVRGIISDYTSTSEEFNTALQKDFHNMLKIDEEKGLKRGATLKSLLSDWNQDSLFAYYLGVKKPNTTRISKYLQQREMFAQMCSLITNGHTARANFDKKALEYFPNTYKFVSNLLLANN